MRSFIIPPIYSETTQIYSRLIYISHNKQNLNADRNNFTANNTVQCRILGKFHTYTYTRVSFGKSKSPSEILFKITDLQITVTGSGRDRDGGIWLHRLVWNPHRLWIIYEGKHNFPQIRATYFRNLFVGQSWLYNGQA